MAKIRLDNKFIRELKKEAHHIAPVVYVGKNGFSEQVLMAIDAELTVKELIKVKFADFKDEKKEICQKIEENLKCSLITIVGNIAVFYRKKISSIG